MTTMQTSSSEQLDLSAVDQAEPINREQPGPEAKPDAPEPTSLADMMANLGKEELNKLLAMTGRTEVKYDAAKGDFVFDTFEGLQRVALLYVRAGMGKRLIERGESLKESELVARMTVVLQAGAQLGLSTFASARYIAWVRGNACPWGDAIPAIIYCAKNPDGKLCVKVFDEVTEQYQPEGKGPKRWRTTCTIVRIMPAGGEKKVIQTFSWDDAAAASLTNSPTWQAYEKRMTQCRARSWAARDAVPDAMCGMVAAEEALDQVYAEENAGKSDRATTLTEKLDKLADA